MHYVRNLKAMSYEIKSYCGVGKTCPRFLGFPESVYEFNFQTALRALWFTNLCTFTDVIILSLRK